MMKILVPVDGSENSMRAAEYALNMAKFDPTLEITLLAVACYYQTFYLGDTLLHEESLYQKCRDIFAENLAKAKKIFDDAGIPVKAELQAGDPGELIPDYVEDKAIDEVVMGSRGLSPFKGAALGSATFKVLNRVKVPVTVVK